MPKIKLESSVQTDILKELKDYGYAYKHPPSPKGIPDIHFMSVGGNLWFEVKRSSKEKPSSIQLVRHKKMRKAGQLVYVVWSWLQVKEILNEQAITKIPRKRRGKRKWATRKFKRL